MGYSLEFGPPPDDLSPGDAVEHPADWETWKGSRRLRPSEIDALVDVVGDAGLRTSEEAGRISVEGNFESFCFGPDGGWLSKPSRDEREYAEQWDLLVQLCDLAGWVIYDPQDGALLYAPQFETSEVVSPDRLVSEAIEALQRRDGDVLGAVTTLRRYSGDDRPVLMALALAMRPPHDDAVRREAAAALRDAGRHAGVALSHLTEALADPDSQVRSFAAQALGQLGYAARCALPKLRAMSSDEDYGPRLAADAAVQRIEQSPEPSPSRTSTPVATTEGELVDATIVFAGPKVVVAKTPNGHNVTLKLPDSGLAKGDVVRVAIASNGKPREVELPGPDGSRRRSLLT